MFDEMAKDINAVVIATPNHHHFLPSMIAMELGIGSYTEKPMGHTIQQIHQMAEASLKYKVPTQMGNQGHCDEWYPLLCEYIQAGAIGKVTEVHCWSDRNNGLERQGRPPTEPVPPGLHWEEWIGPSVFRDYHKGLHPHDFHNWYDFGNGSIGNMGCHNMDAPVGALKLKYPTTIEMEASMGGSDEGYPFGCRVRLDYPARGDLPPVKLYWYDGNRPAAGQGAGDWSDAPPGGKNRPAPVLKFEKENPGRNLGGGGSLYVGEKGLMYSGTWGESVRILPEDKMKAFPKPAPTLPRVKGGIFGDFFNACRQGKPITANPFPVGAVTTESVLLVNLAQKAGVGKKVQWDGEAMKCTNIPELNKMVVQEYRKGWSPKQS
jgi:hypothetical protein